MVCFQSLFVLFLLLQAVSSNDNCSSWPTGLSSIRECCLFPKKHESHTEFSCQKICLSKLEDKDIFKQTNSEGTKIFRSCLEECYLKNMTSAEGNGKFDKKSARNIYLHTGSYMVNEEWRHVIEAATDKCELGSTASLSENLAIFFDCMENYFSDNCIEFKPSESCSKVKYYAKKCKSFKQNCIFAPEYIDACCDHPVLFTTKIIQKCWKNCDVTEYFISLKDDCVSKCLQDETNLRSEDDKFNSEVIKKLLSENSNKTVDWSKEIEHSVEKCAAKGKWDFQVGFANLLQVMVH
jgi:hypothetical protein